MSKLKIKAISMAYDKGFDIIDQTENELKSKFSMNGKLFKSDEYELCKILFRLIWFQF